MGTQGECYETSHWAEKWARNGKFHEPSHETGTGLRLPVEWYRDVLRAKLVSIRIPERLLVAYRDRVLPLLREGVRRCAPSAAFDPGRP